MTKEEKEAIDRLNAKKAAKKAAKQMHSQQVMIIPSSVQITPAVPGDSSKVKKGF